MHNDLKVFIGRANPPLGFQVCTKLGIEPGQINISEFADGEIYVQIHENVRESDVFVIQPTSPPVNTNLMELLITVDALKRSSAGRITAVIPYFGYARQDRIDKPRVPITAKLTADLLHTSGMDRVLTLDLHAGQVQGFFNMPVDHLYATPVLTRALRELMGSFGLNENESDLVVVSPDAGGVERARVYANRLGASLAIVDKRRDKNIKNTIEVMNVIGDVSGKNAIIVDDLIDTAGTLIKAAETLKKQGAKRVFAAATHGVFSSPAFQRLASSQLEKVLVTNSINQPAHSSEANGRLEILAIGDFLADAIKRIHTGESVSKLYS